MKLYKIVILGLLLIGSVVIFVLWDFQSLTNWRTGNIDSIQVYKSRRSLLIYNDGVVSGKFKISLGFTPKGKKQFEKDGKTPEGLYEINAKNANSIAHKNLGISYPNKDDKKYARLNGKKPGGDIKIHGLLNKFGIVGKFHRLYDWTAGCIAVTDDEMDNLNKKQNRAKPYFVKFLKSILCFSHYFPI